MACEEPIKLIERDHVRGVQASWHPHHDDRTLVETIDLPDGDPANPRVDALEDHLREPVSLPVEVEARLVESLDEQFTGLTVPVSPLSDSEHDVPAERVRQRGHCAEEFDAFVIVGLG